MLIYKITSTELWNEAKRQNAFTGAPIDLADGYIHFSTAAQAIETAAKHFSGQNDLLLVALEAESLGAALKWEVSRGAALFPHLYGTFAPKDALWVKALPLGPDDAHVFPDLTER